MLLMLRCSADYVLAAAAAASVLVCICVRARGAPRQEGGGGTGGEYVSVCMLERRRLCMRPCASVCQCMRAISNPRPESVVFLIQFLAQCQRRNSDTW